MDVDRLLLAEKVGDGVAYLTMNRPEKRNALSADLRAAIPARLRELAADGDVRVIILRGAGSAFSSGADLDDPRYQTADTVDEYRAIRRGLENFLGIWDVQKPIIAQVHGHCLGVAMAMCNFCDLVLVAEDAKIGYPHIATGGGGYLNSLNFWVLGYRKASELELIHDEWLSGREAVAIGWANRTFPAPELETETLALASRMASVDPGAMMVRKAANHRLLDMHGFRATVMMAAEFDTIGLMSDFGRGQRQKMRHAGYRSLLSESGGG